MNHPAKDQAGQRRQSLRQPGALARPPLLIFLEALIRGLSGLTIGVFFVQPLAITNEAIKNVQLRLIERTFGFMGKAPVQLQAKTFPETH